jgi:hypothetical protein
MKGRSQKRNRHPGLKGTLTLDVVDKILFASGEATVKKEGLHLKLFVNVLRT